MFGAWLSRILTGAWIKIAGALAAIAAAFAIYAAIRRSGRDAERAAANIRILKDTETRHEIDREVARVPDPADELRKHWSRD